MKKLEKKNKNFLKILEKHQEKSSSISANVDKVNFSSFYYYNGRFY
jgi:hypothetical protein